MKYHLPVYLHSANYAKEFQETIDYRASFRFNLQCRDAICEAIDAHYRNDRLDEAAVREVVEQFGYERTMVVLANTVRMKDWDRRFPPTTASGLIRFLVRVICSAKEEGNFWPIRFTPDWLICLSLRLGRTMSVSISRP